EAPPRPRADRDPGGAARAGGPAPGRGDTHRGLSRRRRRLPREAAAGFQGTLGLTLRADLEAEPAGEPVRRAVRRGRLVERRLDPRAVALLGRAAEPLHGADDGVVLVEPLLRRLLLVLRRFERPELVVALACERERVVDV